MSPTAAYNEYQQFALDLSVPPLRFLRGKNTTQLGLTHPLPSLLHTHAAQGQTHTSLYPSAEDVNPSVFSRHANSLRHFLFKDMEIVYSTQHSTH